jgi:hypothetical protein
VFDTLTTTLARSAGSLGRLFNSSAQIETE